MTTRPMIGVNAEKTQRTSDYPNIRGQLGKCEDVIHNICIYINRSIILVVC